MTFKEPDFIFQCRKCEHQAYVDKKEVYKLIDYDCPNCGEEAYCNWIIVGEGNFEEHENQKTDDSGS